MTLIEYITPIADQLRYPWVPLLILPLFIIFFIIIKKDFVKLRQEDEKERKTKKRLGYFTLFMRTLVFAALLISIAQPYVTQQTEIQGDPKLKILMDNSTSYDIFDKNIALEMKTKLEGYFPVELRYIAEGTRSDIGDSILDYAKKDDAMLLISDGSSNYGSSLADAALFLKQLNASVNILDSPPVHNDAWVTITGPSKVVANAEEYFKVNVKSAKPLSSYRLTIMMDNTIILDAEVSGETYEFKHVFTSGQHRLTAKIDVIDYFPDNNIYYKTVKVVPKPKVLFMGSSSSPLYKLLSPLYDLDADASLSADLSKYYAIIANNQHEAKLRDIDSLTGYLNDGNGILVVGGDKSYHAGAYKNSMIETILPVNVGTGDRKKSDATIVFAIDVSGTFGRSYVAGPQGTPVLLESREQMIQFSKALIISALRDISLTNRVGAVAFTGKMYVLQNIDYLYNNRDELIYKIQRLQGQGSSEFAQGIRAAYDLLKDKGGAKSIILVTDGQTAMDEIRQDTLQTAAALASRGVKLYTIGVGHKINTEFLKQVGEYGQGFYIEPTKMNKLTILFGKAEKEGDIGKAFDLFVLNEQHFITEDLPVNGTLYGFNSVIPKPASQLLVTTMNGDPILTVWRFSLGRVAALTTDDGTNFAGELLSGNNSRLLTRTMNWLIGEPDRKNMDYADVKDTRLGEEAEIIVRSETVPKAEKVAFYKIADNTYSGSIKAESSGFHTVMDSQFAVNYAKEFENLGINQELLDLVVTTDGEVLNKDNIEQIVEAVKRKSRKVVEQRTDYRWPFIVAAALLFLIEVGVRKIAETLSK